MESVYVYFFSTRFFLLNLLSYVAVNNENVYALC